MIAFILSLLLTSTSIQPLQLSRIEPDSIAKADNLSSVDEAERLRELFRQKIEQTNHVGAVATDFRIITRDGRETTLNSLDADRDILLIFYNPDCDTCHKAMEEITANGLDKKYHIVAIDAEEDRDEWESTASTLPAGWTVAFALDPIQDDETYFILDTPTLYLLSPSKTILLKDFPLDRLITKEK